MCSFDCNIYACALVWLVMGVCSVLSESEAEELLEDLCCMAQGTADSGVSARSTFGSQGNHRRTLLGTAFEASKKFVSASCTSEKVFGTPCGTLPPVPPQGKKVRQLQQDPEVSLACNIF